MFSLTMKETHRYKIISEVNDGYFKVKEVAEILGLSQRQIYRIKARVQKEGPKGVIHKSKGKKNPRWLTDGIRDKIDHLYKTKYRPKGLKLKDVFCLKEERTVAGDNTISYKGKAFQILPNEYRISFVKAKVKVHEHLDGSIHIFYQGKKLKHKLIPKQRVKRKENELITVNY